VTEVRTNFVTHSASVVTVVETEGPDTTCTESTTLGGLPTGLPGSTPTDATSTPQSTFTRLSGVVSATRSNVQSFSASGTRVPSSRASGSGGRGSRPSGSGVRSSRPSGTPVGSSRPSGSAIRASASGVNSGSVTTIIGSTTTERVYTTVDASAATSVVTVSGVKQSGTAVRLSSSGAKVIATATASGVLGGGQPVHSTSVVTAHPSSLSSAVPKPSTSNVVPKPSSSSVVPKPSTSSVVPKPSSTTHSSSSSAVKTSPAPTATKGGATPVETTKVVYKGVQKVEPFMK
jgi:hypothetical protein